MVSASLRAEPSKFAIFEYSNKEIVGISCLFAFSSLISGLCALGEVYAKYENPNPPAVQKTFVSMDATSWDV